MRTNSALDRTYVTIYRDFFRVGVLNVWLQLENLADALLRLSTTGDVVPGVDFGECAAVAGKLAVQLREFTDNLPSPASESAPSKVSQV